MRQLGDRILMSTSASCSPWVGFEKVRRIAVPKLGQDFERRDVDRAVAQIPAQTGSQRSTKRLSWPMLLPHRTAP